MSTLQNPVDNWHSPSPSAALDIPATVSDELGKYTSVSGALDWACQKVFGKTPAAWVVDQFDGDWRALSTAGDCLNQLGTWIQTMADNATGLSWSSSGEWTGQAANAAKEQFAQVNKKLSPAPEQIRACGRATQRLASHVYLVAAAVAALVESIVAGLASVIFPPALVSAVASAIRALAKVIGFISDSLRYINTLIKQIQGHGTSLSALPKIKLTTGYDNPMVS
ncbi:MAG: hypothetical protein ACTH2Q_13280 [Propionibacteriaceae bacterium]